MCVEFYEVSDFVYLPPTPLCPSSINLQHLNLTSEAECLKTDETWCVPILHANRVTTVGFYFTNYS